MILGLFLQGPVLDFGKIIIYTSNLKIIRAPHRRGESRRSPHRSQDRKESSPGRESRSKGRHRTTRSHAEEPDVMTEQKVSTVWSSVDCKYSWFNAIYLCTMPWLLIIMVRDLDKALALAIKLWHVTRPNTDMNDISSHSAYWGEIFYNFKWLD